MEVSKGIIRIDIKQNITPTDIEIIGLGMDGYVILKYKIEDRMHYTQYYPDRRMQNYLFFEVVNNSPLWNITYDVTPYNGWNSSNIFYFNNIIRIKPT